MPDSPAPQARLTETGTARISPTERPNGSLYRPRKPLRAEACVWNEESTAVLIYGTHDRSAADALAAAEWRREGLGGDLPEPAPVWLKTVPWDALGFGYDRTILEVHGNTKGSTPALRYGGE